MLLLLLEKEETGDRITRDNLGFVLLLLVFLGLHACIQDYEFVVATSADGSSNGKPTDEALVLAAVAAAVKAPTAKGATPIPGSGGDPGAAETPRGDTAKGGGGALETPELTAEDKEAQEKRLENAEKRRAYRERRKRRREEGLFVPPKKNPNIYVSGLPLDFTEANVAELFRKAGVFKVDPQTRMHLSLSLSLLSNKVSPSANELSVSLLNTCLRFR